MNAPTTPGRRRRSDGDRSRQSILLAAARLASVVGLEGLTIGSLARELGISKSGLFAHFGSKEDLELATVDAAMAIFDAEVLSPARAAPPGIARLRALTRAFVEHVERRTFPGGCFFAAVAAEFDGREGVVRQRVFECVRGWLGLVESLVREAQGAGEVDRGADAAQIAFEIQALLAAANAGHQMSGERDPLDRALRGIESILDRAAVKGGKRGGR